ncbi:MAG: trypsin-like peptidase domain-containing protein [Lachnospiraceae bacterium]|nr:trypsin-like peptidase domain-containing protein [Lachnospiraceae bacterium]
MKRRTALLMIVVLTALLFGCGKQEPKKGPYEVRFEMNGGSRVSGSLHQEVEHGEAAVAPKLEREGYEFDGWDRKFDEITEDTVIKAKWKKTVVVTFDLNGGELVSGAAKVTLTAGQKPVAPGVKMEGYTFLGWEPAISEVDEDTVYKAKWERTVLTPDGIYEKLSASMVEIHTFDKNGQGLGLGSGFFIDDNGTVLTNFHVMEGACSAEIITYNDERFQVSAIAGFSKDIDLCVVKTDAGKTVAAALFDGDVKTGESVYTIGSSIGLTGTFSDGIVSTASRVDNDVEYIQITAPISKGNSGGPLVNRYGEVIGVNTFQFTDGQNLNFAVSIKELAKIDRSVSTEIKKFGEDTGKGAGTGAKGTVVQTGDEGEFVYQFAAYIEQEPNDSIEGGNKLVNGELTAGHLDPQKDPGDVYSVKMDRAGTLDVYVMAYWEDDDYLMQSYLLDQSGKLMGNAVTGRDALIDYQDYDTVEKYMVASFRIQQPGTYYVYVTIPGDFPYPNGCYYLVGAEWY